MVSQNDNTPTSQITLSQYEYRVARLPRRDSTRRRRRRQAISTDPSEHLIPVTTIESELLVVPSSETTIDYVDTLQLRNVPTPEAKYPTQHRRQIQQHFRSSSTPVIANESQLQSYVDAVTPAPAPPMPMRTPMDEDDRELLRLASPCDSDMPSRDADESRVLRSKTRILTPGSASTTRESFDSSFTEHQPRRPAKRAKKKKNNKLSNLNLLGNQLVMVARDASRPEDAVSFNDEPKSSMEDEIEDSQLYGPVIKKPRATSEARKTVSGTQLRRKYNQQRTKSPKEQFITPIRKRNQSWNGAYGDGFDVDERTMVITVPRSGRPTKSRPRPRTHTITVPSLEIGPAANNSASLSRLHDDNDTMATVETTEATPPEKIEDDPEPDHTETIAKMAATLRQDELMQTSKHSKTVSRAPIARSHGRQALQTPLSMSVSTEIDNNEAQHNNISPQTTKKAKRTCKPPHGEILHFSTAASRGDGFFAGRAHTSENASQSPTPALSRPGNLSMMTNLDYDEAEEEPIEDDHPPPPRPSYSAASKPTMGPRPLFPSKSILNITPRRTVDDFHSEAAYPTPQTTARILSEEKLQHGSPLKPFDLRVSRGQYNDLAHDMIRDDAIENAAEHDGDYSRPNTAGKVSGIAATQSTQAARHGMAFDDNSEVLWDGSMRSSTLGNNIPQAVSRKLLADRVTSKVAPSTIAKVTPRAVKLKQLTRTMSRQCGTLSPEKSIQRRTSSLSTFKAPFKTPVEPRL